jgi:hypothetical protein
VPCTSCSRNLLSSPTGCDSGSRPMPAGSRKSQAMLLLFFKLASVGLNQTLSDPTPLPNMWVANLKQVAKFSPFFSWSFFFVRVLVFRKSLEPVHPCCRMMMEHSDVET